MIWCLIAVEAALGCALLAGFALSVAASAVGIMMVGFSVVWVVLRSHGADDCNCFGGKADSPTRTVLARNLLLAFGATTIAVASRLGLGTEANLPAWSFPPGQLLFGGVFAISAWLFWSLLTAIASSDAIGGAPSHGR
jgi:hypothetical protein